MRIVAATALSVSLFAAVAASPLLAQAPAPAAPAPAAAAPAAGDPAAGERVSAEGDSRLAKL